MRRVRAAAADVKFCVAESQLLQLSNFAAHSQLIETQLPGRKFDVVKT